MQLKAETKARLVKIGGIIFPIGIVLLVIGTAIQITLFIMSNGKAQVGGSAGMVWGGIIAALGIPVIVGGRIMLMIGKWRHEEDDDPAEEAPPRQNV